MRVFNHHLYEYCKGLRNLVLHTLETNEVEAAVAKLDEAGIDHVVYPVNGIRSNLFFGADECVAVIRKIGKPRLTEYRSEEDFMLGIMLGYDRRRQCERYLEFKAREKPLKLCQCVLKGANCNHD